jgi:hypothetical protein
LKGDGSRKLRSTVTRRALIGGLILGLVGSFSTVPAAAQGQPIDRLEALGRVLRSEPAWTASYHQEYLPVGMTLGEEVDGRVWVAWPDNALFRAGDPVNREMGLEGRRVRLLDLELSSCDDHQLSDDEWARIPLAAVLDPKTAVERFTVLGLDGDGLALVPREPGGVARVEVALAADHLPVEVVIVDPQGATNTLVFSDWEPRPTAPDPGWLPAPPPGVECLEDGP